MRPKPKLATLRSKLEALRRGRHSVRIGAALSGLLVAALAILAAAFAVDWSFEMNRPQRIVMLGLCAASLAWAFRRLALPWLGVKETALEMALRIERAESIDGDLVAALELERPEVASWGSRDLADAVIARAADLERGIDVYRDFSRQPFFRRAAVALLLGAAVAVAATAYPAHAAAFFDRMLLGSRHYPTRTVIERIAIDGRNVFPSASASTPRIARGRPFRVEVAVSGEIPPSAEALLRTIDGGIETSIELKPIVPDGSFAGELPRLGDSVAYQVYAGDAWTEPGRVIVLAWPAASIELTALAPAYARTREDAEPLAPGARLADVVEGSTVHLRVTCANKSLRKASVTVGGREFPLALGENGRSASLDVAGTPFERVAEPLGYSVAATDEDGLELEHPLQGSIRIKSDQAPRVAAAMVTRFALPSGKPTISYGATDDYGLSRLEARIQSARADGKSDERRLPIYELPRDAEPQSVVRGRFTLELAALQVAKGDQLTIAIEATDHRGLLEGKTAASEPFVLYVTDERGIFAALSGADERSAKQLDGIIERQLGIGTERPLGSGDTK